ncbi:MAG: hypothetical protein IGNPGNKH_00365 [Sodalis sp. Ffu]|nr:MAG: hypothetical protein IGNPGNKH_00365 [Sodalis sp. Ffu]
MWEQILCPAITNLLLRGISVSITYHLNLTIAISSHFVNSGCILPFKNLTTPHQLS